MKSRLPQTAKVASVCPSNRTWWRHGYRSPDWPGVSWRPLLWDCSNQLSGWPPFLQSTQRSRTFGTLFLCCTACRGSACSCCMTPAQRSTIWLTKRSWGHLTQPCRGANCSYKLTDVLAPLSPPLQACFYQLPILKLRTHNFKGGK